MRRQRYIGDLIPSPLAGLSTRLDRMQKQPVEIQRMVRATLRGIAFAKNHRQESARSIMQWVGLVQELAEGSYDMAVSGWSSNGAASPKGLQIVMQEIRSELKLDAVPDPARAFDFSFVRK
jgi:ABC-type nitrate/sulfonate/bicarbonate transport system substrate-binding protein